MLSIALTVAVAFTTLEPSATTPAHAAMNERRVMVLPLHASGVSAEVAHTTTSLLAVALQRHMPDAEVLSADDVKAMADVEAEKQLVGCSDSSCLAEIAGALGAQRIVHGEIASLGDELVLTINIYDASTQSAKRESTAMPDEKHLRVAVDDVVARLTGNAPQPHEISWMTWAGVATAGVGALVGGASAYAGLGAVQTLEDAKTSGTDKEKASSLRPLWATGAVVGVVVAVVGVGVTTYAVVSE